MFEAPSWTPERVHLRNEILAEFRATAARNMQLGAAHPPGCDAGDEADLIESIFGERP